MILMVVFIGFKKEYGKKLQKMLFTHDNEGFSVLAKKEIYNILNKIVINPYSEPLHKIKDQIHREKNDKEA